MSLIKSERARLADRISNDEKFKFKYGPIIKVTIEKNKLKNRGIKIKPIGIKILKLSSNVNENVIQCIPLR